MKYIKYMALSLAVIALGACTGEFEEINKNPNRLDEGSISPVNLLEPILMDGSNSLAYNQYHYANEMAQVTVASASNVREEHRYNFGDGDFQGRWNLFYNWAQNANHMYQLAVQQNDPNFQAIGLTLKVYYMAMCTDLFGDIPYTEALQGAAGILRPKVDSQKEVYEAMFNDLTTANSLYRTSAGISDALKDALYQGDLNKWRKFTNTLHLRLLMRVSGRNSSFSPTVGDRINAILSDPATYPVFESNADNAAVRYSGSTVYYRNYFNVNDIATDGDFSGSHHVSERFLDMLIFADGSVDPRLPIWCKPRYSTSKVFPWKGAVSGCTKDYGNNIQNKDYEAFLHYETLVRETNSNHLLDYDELCFIKAEAALNGWISGSAEEYYNAAIKASCEKWNEYGQYASFPVENGGKVTFTNIKITPADIEQLLSREEVRYDGSQQRIAEQKWLALFWVCGFEMYAEMRRTGYPECKTGAGTVQLNRTDGKFIARWMYPNIAIANNRDNYLTAIQNMGGQSIDDNTMTLPVWWSGQAINNWPHSFRNLTFDER